MGGSHLRRRHGWTLAEYRDAFQLAMQVPTCSQALSQRRSPRARELVERGEFGVDARGPVNRRPARVRP
jgi:predicted transcriptional regulator